MDHPQFREHLSKRNLSGQARGTLVLDRALDIGLLKSLEAGLIKFEGPPQPVICAALWLEVTMRDLFLLTTQQLNRINPRFPVSHGVPRADDRRDHLWDPVWSSMERCSERLWATQDALQSVCPLEPGRDLEQDFRELSRYAGARDCLMIETTHLKAHRTAASLYQTGQSPAVLAARKVA